MSEANPVSATPFFRKAQLIPLAVFCLVSLLLKENYPISDYPMYSGIASRTHYFYLADGEGKPIPTRENFGKSASAIKKFYGAHLNEIADRMDKNSYELGPEELAQAGSALLAQLRERGAKRSYWKKNHPESIRLVRVDVSRDGSGIVKEEKIVVEEPSGL